MDVSTSKVRKRDTVQILKESLGDAPTIQDEVRYKIIIHSSDDDSLVRVLFQYKILERHWKGAGKVRVYMCSHFPGDTELQKVRFSVIVWQNTLNFLETDMLMN